MAFVELEECISIFSLYISFFFFFFKAIAIDSRLSLAKVRWRQPAVSSELSLVTAS